MAGTTEPTQHPPAAGAQRGRAGGQSSLRGPHHPAYCEARCARVGGREPRRASQLPAAAEGAGRAGAASPLRSAGFVYVGAFLSVVMATSVGLAGQGAGMREGDSGWGLGESTASLRARRAHTTGNVAALSAQPGPAQGPGVGG